MIRAMTCTGNAKVNSRTSSARPRDANRSMSSWTTTSTSSVRHRSSSAVRNDGDTSARLRAVLGSFEFQQGAAHDRAHDLVVDRRREGVGMGQHRLALVVPEHRHAEIADLPGADLGEGVSHHHPMSARASRSRSCTFSTCMQQPVLQLGRVELLESGSPAQP